MSARFPNSESAPKECSLSTLLVLISDLREQLTATVASVQQISWAEVLNLPSIILEIVEYYQVYLFS